MPSARSARSCICADPHGHQLLPNFERIRPPKPLLALSLSSNFSSARSTKATALSRQRAPANSEAERSANLIFGLLRRLRWPSSRVAQCWRQSLIVKLSRKLIESIAFFLLSCLSLKNKQTTRRLWGKWASTREFTERDQHFCAPSFVLLSSVPVRQFNSSKCSRAKDNSCSSLSVSFQQCRPAGRPATSYSRRSDLPLAACAATEAVRARTRAPLVRQLNDRPPPAAVGPSRTQRKSAS